jgi:hypothetical protein
LISQVDLSDLLRDANLSKSESELLAFRSKYWNLLDLRVTKFSFLKSQNIFFLISFVRKLIHYSVIILTLSCKQPLSNMTQINGVILWTL